MSLYEALYKLKQVSEQGNEWTDGRIHFSVPPGFSCKKVDNPVEDMTISIEITNSDYPGKARITGYYDNDARRYMKWRWIRRFLWKKQFLPTAEEALKDYPKEILDDTEEDRGPLRIFYRKMRVNGLGAPLITEISMIVDTATSDYCDVRSYSNVTEPLDPVKRIISSLEFLPELYSI